MALDFPASGQALWALFDQTGIRPEYAIMSMMLESGLNPAAVNSVGCTGLNQMCQGIPDGYAGWAASQQISQVITPFWANLVKLYGPIGSGARLEQGNMYPASLKTARWLWSPVVTLQSDAPAYNGNAAAFDPGKTGAITVGGIASALAALVGSTTVADAIAQTYAIRPYELPVDPVYGSDFFYRGNPLMLGALLVDGVERIAATVKGWVSP